MTTAVELPQHMRALKRANEIRLGRAEVKRHVGSGAKRVADLLDPVAAVPECLLGMSIAELLQAQERWGPRRTRKLLTPLGISEKRPVGNLTPRQRRFICEALRTRSGQRDPLLVSR